MKKGKETTKTFSVKMPIWSWKLLNIIAESREHGTNGNDLLKKCLEFVIESAKICSPVPSEFRTLLDMLRLDTAWHGGFNFADASARMDIAQVVLILQQHNDKGEPRKGFGLAMIDRPYSEESKITLCVDDILERITEIATPGNYKMLRKVGERLGTNSIRETLTLLADDQTLVQLEESDHDELPQMGNFHDYGKTIEWGRKFKTKQHRTPDGEAHRQLKIVFEKSTIEEEEPGRDLNAELSTGHALDDTSDDDDMPRPLGYEW